MPTKLHIWNIKFNARLIIYEQGESWGEISKNNKIHSNIPEWYNYTLQIGRGTIRNVLPSLYESTTPDYPNEPQEIAH